MLRVCAYAALTACVTQAGDNSEEDEEQDARSAAFSRRPAAAAQPLRGKGKRRKHAGGGAPRT